MQAFHVLLLAPPIFDFYHTPARREPLGLLYIKAALEELDGVRVTLYDATLSGRRKTAALPAAMGHLGEFYPERDTAAFSLLQRYQRFGDSLVKVGARARSLSPDLIAISSLFSAYHPDVEILITELKKSLPDCPIAVGGWAVRAQPRTIAAAGQADFYCTGDGELVMPRLVSALRAGRRPNPLPDLLSSPELETETIDRRPVSPFFHEKFPRRQDPYFWQGKRIANLIMSKGCKRKCAFCAIHRGYDYIRKPLPTLDSELHYLQSQGVEVVNFEDDNLFADPGEQAELLSLLQGYHQTELHYTAMNGITATNLAPIIDQVLDAGFCEINLSLVSSSAPTLAAAGRPAFREAITTIADHCRTRVPVIVFVIAGMPENTITELIEDLLFLAASPVTIGYSPLYLLPGLPYFKDFTFPADSRLLRGSALYSFGPAFQRADIASLWKWVRLVNRLKLVEDEIDEALAENLHWFARSCREGRWYARRGPSNWYPTFAFSTPIPQSFNVVDDAGKSTLWNLDDYD